MSVVGHVFSAIGSLFGGGEKSTPASATTINNVAAPETPAPQQQAGSRNNSTKSMDPTFLSAAAVPNLAAAPTGNVPGKTLLGQ